MLDSSKNTWNDDTQTFSDRHIGITVIIKSLLKHNNTLIFKNLRLTLPGQGAVLLQTLDSLKGPLQCVPYGETHVLVRTCDPWPHVTEHELHWDHSSAPDSPVWEKGDTS